MSDQDVRDWIDQFDWTLGKKHKLSIVKLIQRSMIREYVTSIEKLSFMLRANISIVRANLKMSKDALEFFQPRIKDQGGSSSSSHRGLARVNMASFSNPQFIKSNSAGNLGYKNFEQKI
jgi:hypothetical protein